MALPDLSGSLIQETYQRVLHIGDDGVIYNGTGSQVLDATELLELQTLGSNNVAWPSLASIDQNLGVESDATFNTVTLNVQPSQLGETFQPLLRFPDSHQGQRSHLGINDELNGHGLSIGVEDDDNILYLNVDGGANPTVFTFNTAGKYSGEAASASFITTAAQPNITSVGTLTALTASGGISSSGNITANHYFMKDHIAIAETTDKIAFGFENNTAIQIGKSGNPTEIKGHLTASGNISSSGDLYFNSINGGTF